MKKLKKMLALLLCLCALLPVLSCAESNEEILQNFVLKHGDRNEKKICITIDDCYVARRDNIVRDVELCNQYGIHMTFFPIVKTGCLSEKYRDIWQSVLDAGCEIGCHGYQHLHLGSFDYWTLLKRLGRWQEELDKTLGYHYQTRWLRPPYGSISGGKKLNETKLTSALKRFGFDHVIHWDVSETHADQALEKVQNGSIMLFHANHKDTKCLEEIIPVLLEQGYEFVTLSEMFGFDPPDTSDELYVYDRANYEKE